MATPNGKSPQPPTNLSPSFVDLDEMQGMEELLQTDQAATYAQGKRVPVTVVEKRDNGVVVHFAFKSDSFIPKEEFPNWTEIKEGDTFDAILEQMENDEGAPQLSVMRALQEQAWDRFTQTHVEGGIIKGLVKKRVKGGLIVDLGGVESFLPGSQVDTSPVRNMDDLLGSNFDFKILKITNERRNVVISRRELLEEEKSRLRTKLLAELMPGQLRKGMVKNITDFGAFVDLKGIDGLVHITDMSWGRIAHPSEVVQIGQELEAVILDVDRQKERVSLGLKQKTQDPWDSVEDRYPAGTRIKGKVVNVMPYGAFVEIEQGVEGLVHVSEMSWTKRVSRASDVVAAGQEVEAVVLDIQRDAKKISLGIRQTLENPWEAAVKRFPPGTHIKGKVRNMTSYGAFVEIEPDIDGMVHVSDLSWTRKINNPAEVLKKGQEVEAIVLDIDPKQQRISLGMKQLTDDPWTHIEQYFQLDAAVKGKVSKITSFGAFVQLDHDIDGLIHISQLSEERVAKVRDVLKVGDDVEARVIKIDAGERRIGLSLRAARGMEVGGAPSRPSHAATTGGGADRPLRPGEHLVDVGDVWDAALEEGRDDEDSDDEKK